MKKLKLLSVRVLSFILIVIPLIFIGNKANATTYNTSLVLVGAQEVPPSGSPAIGSLLGTYDDATNELSFTLTFNGLIGTTTAAHFHGPADPGVNGPVVIPLAGFPLGVQSGFYTNTFVLTDEQESLLFCGTLYVNVHTTSFPGGEIRAQVEEQPAAGNITPLNIGVIGQNEVPGNASPAKGLMTGTYDQLTKQLSINLTFSDLLGPTTAAHLHGPAPAGVNGPVEIPLAGFPVGVLAGAYANSFVLTPEQETQLFSGLIYVNIHTTFLAGGEIRGQLVHGDLVGDCGTPTVPLSNWALLMGGLLMAVFTAFMLRKRF